MSVRRAAFVALSLILICLIPSGAARADTIVIEQTGGLIFLTADPEGNAPPLRRFPAVFSLFGPGLSVTSTITPGNTGGATVGDVPARDLCPCGPGTTVSLTNVFSGNLGPGMATVNGVSYFNAVFSGMLTLSSDPLVLPSSGPDFKVTQEFLFSAMLTGTALMPGVDNPIFTATLRGQGTVTFTFYELTRDPNNPRYQLALADYRLQPIPEPATLVLLGTGLAGVAAAARRRRNLKDKG